jgi:hypothetical protein
MPLVLHRKQCGICFPHFRFAAAHALHALVSKTLVIIGYIGIDSSVREVPEYWWGTVV